MTRVKQWKRIQLTWTKAIKREICVIFSIFQWQQLKQYWKISNICFYVIPLGLRKIEFEQNHNCLHNKGKISDK